MESSFLEAENNPLSYRYVSEDDRGHKNTTLVLRGSNRLPTAAGGVCMHLTVGSRLEQVGELKYEWGWGPEMQIV